MFEFIEKHKIIFSGIAIVVIIGMLVTLLLLDRNTKPSQEVTTGQKYSEQSLF